MVLQEHQRAEERCGSASRGALRGRQALVGSAGAPIGGGTSLGGRFVARWVCWSTNR